MKIRLVPLEGGDPIVLARPLSIVGRQEECDIAIPHKSVSKQHCVLAMTDGTVFLRDLGSTNGTRVNGQRVRRAALLPNDRISFASFGFRVAFGEAPVESAHTEQIDGAELEQLRRMKLDAEADRPEGGDGIALGPTVSRNELPDVL